MPRRNLEQPDVKPFEFRSGVTMPPYGGMYRRGDPAQIPANRLHLGVNIRLAGDEPSCRPGLTYVEGDEESACVTGIFEIEDFAVAVLITQLGLQPFSDMQILAFNEERSPVTQEYWDGAETITKSTPSPWRKQDTGDCFNSFQVFNDTLLIVNGLDVYQAEFSEDEELPRLDLSLLFTLADASGANITSTCVRRERVDDAQTGGDFEKDVLYMGCEDGEIWRYDGTTIELVHTLASGGNLQIISWNGSGLVAAGDNAGGFCYQEQPGYAWSDVAWGMNFNCNGLCEFLGQVVFVGDWDDVLGAGKWGAYALNWNGTGAPAVFASEVPTTVNEADVRFRTPVVAGGAVHWLYFAVENDTPPNNSSARVARYTDFSTGSIGWHPINSVSSAPDDEPGFFIPYRGAMLIYERADDSSISLITSGPVGNTDLVYEFSQKGGGQGWEGLPI